MKKFIPWRVVAVGFVAAALLLPVPSLAANCEKKPDHPSCGGGGGDEPTGNAKVRADFLPCHDDSCTTETAIQSDREGTVSPAPPMPLLTPCENTYDYWDPADLDCVVAGQPQIDKSGLNDKGAWNFIIEQGEAATNSQGVIEIKRWVVLDFSMVPKEVNKTSFEFNDGDDGIVQVPADGCIDLDELLYANPKFATDGGPPVDASKVDPDDCRDNLVLTIRTDRKVSIFDVPDGEVGVEVLIKAPSDPASEIGGGRFWPPHFKLKYGTLHKETVDADVVILSSTGGHSADLVQEVGSSGPPSKRTIGTYTLPLRVKIKRVFVPPPA